VRIEDVEDWRIGGRVRVGGVRIEGVRVKDVWD
jgi:hypothetical protein